MPNAAIYVRLSQDREGDKGGNERQERDCRALAKRERLTVAHVYVDDDRSAWNGKPREAFDAMMRDLDRYDAIVFWKVDRLVRRFEQIADVMKACDAAGVRLVSVVDPIDTTSPIMKGVAGLIAGMAEQESHNTSIRVKKLHEANAADGKPHGGRRAFGYETTGRSARRVIPAEADATREAAKRALRGETLASIVRDFNARGIKPASGGVWRVNPLRRLLISPHIAGLRAYHGEIVGPGNWEPIISRELHEQLVVRFGDGKTRRRPRPARYLLSGLLRCGSCGSVMHAKQRSRADGRGRRWGCVRIPGDEHSETHQARCGRLSVVAEPVEELVETEIVKVLGSKALARAIARSSASKAARTAAATIANLEERIASLAREKDDGIIMEPEYLDRRRRLTDRINAARADIAAVEIGELAEFVGARDAAKLWRKKSLAEQRRIAGILLDHVTIQPAGRGGRIFDPERVDPDWRI